MTRKRDNGGRVLYEAILTAQYAKPDEWRKKRRDLIGEVLWTVAYMISLSCGIHFNYGWTGGAIFAGCVFVALFAWKVIRLRNWLKKYPKPAPERSDAAPVS